MSEEIIRIGSRSYSKTFDEYWNRIMKLEQENQQLKELCNKYEEEHKKEFNTWLQGQKVLAELEEWLKTIVKYETLHKSGYMTVRGEWGEEILNKIQELKEKYK